MRTRIIALLSALGLVFGGAVAFAGPAAAANHRVTLTGGSTCDIGVHTPAEAPYKAVSETLTATSVVSPADSTTRLPAVGFVLLSSKCKVTYSSLHGTSYINGTGKWVQVKKSVGQVYLTTKRR